MSNRPNVLIASPLPPRSLESLAAEYQAERLWTVADCNAFLRTHGPRFDVLVTNSLRGADAGLIAALPNLKLIANLGAGCDLIDLASARLRGIVVTSTPGVLDECVAEHALGLLLALSRRIVEGDRFVRSGMWKEGALPLGTQLGGKRCGIAGMGGIGRSIAKLAEAFGMEVAYCGRSPKSDLPYRYHGSLERLAADVDVLILSMPGGASTHHAVNAAVLAALGPKGLLVNVARGSVVDEVALIEALQSRSIAGAALDVFSNEPLVSEAFLSLDNVVLAPHTGSATHECRQAMEDLMLANIKAFACSKPLLTPVA